MTAPSLASVSPGTPVTDHIFVIGAGTANPPFPSSPPNVVFSICGPIATGTCTGIDEGPHGRFPFGASKALTPTAIQGKFGGHLGRGQHGRQSVGPRSLLLRRRLGPVTPTTQPAPPTTAMANASRSSRSRPPLSQPRPTAVGTVGGGDAPSGYRAV